MREAEQALEVSARTPGGCFEFQTVRGSRRLVACECAHGKNPSNLVGLEIIEKAMQALSLPPSDGRA
jgi:hypothetical protein